MNEPNLERSAILQDEAQGPESPDGPRYMLFGPTLNEGQTTYQHGGGAHTIVVMERLSADAQLAHQMRVGGFYRRLDADPVLDPTSRTIREKLLRCESSLRPHGTGRLIPAVDFGVQSVGPAGLVEVAGLPFGQDGFGDGAFGG